MKTLISIGTNRGSITNVVIDKPFNEIVSSDVYKIAYDQFGDDQPLIVYGWALKMSCYEALYIKFLRVRCNGSWRWIAGKYDERYSQRKSFNRMSTNGYNQVSGIELCERAMLMLGESNKDGWNR